MSTLVHEGFCHKQNEYNTSGIYWYIMCFLYMKIQTVPAEEGGAGGAVEKSERPAGKNGAGEPNSPNHS